MRRCFWTESVQFSANHSFFLP